MIMATRPPSASPTAPQHDRHPFQPSPPSPPNRTPLPSPTPARRPCDFHRSLQEDALDALFVHHGQLVAAEVEAVELEVDVDDARRDGADLGYSVRQNRAAITDTAARLSNLLHTTAQLSGSIGNMAADAQTLTRRIDPYYVVDRDNEETTTLLLLPPSLREKLSQTAEDFSNSSFCDGLFLSVKISEAGLKNAGHEFAQLRKQETEAPFDGLIRHWGDVASAIKEIVLHDSLEKRTHSTRTVRRAWSSQHATHTKLQPGERIALMSTFVNKWGLGYKLDEEILRLSIFPLGCFQDTSSSDSPLPVAPPDSDANVDSAALVLSGDPSVTESTLHFSNFRQLLPDYILAIGVQSLRQLASGMKQVSDLTVVLDRLRDTNRANREREARLEERIETIRKTLRRLEVQLPELHEKVGEQVLMLVILSRGL